MFDSLGEAIHVVDSSLKILFMNRAFREWDKKLGIDPRPEGKTVFELFPFLKKSIALEYKKVLKTGELLVTEDWSAVGGRRILTETKKVPLVENGKPVGVITIIRDITEQKRAEEALKASEEKYRSLFNSSEVGMFRTRLDGSEILDMNEKFLKIFGRTREEMRGKPSIIHWAVPSERKEMVRRLKARDRVSDFECRMLNKKGEVRICLASLKLYPDKGILEGSIIDITDRKRTEEKLRESEEFLRSTFNSMDDLVVILGSKGTIIGFHKPPGRVSILDPKFHIGKNYEKVLPWEITEKLKPAIERARTTGLTQHFVHTLETSEKKGWFSVNVSIRRGARGEITGFTIVSRDITESKKAEERIAASEREYRGLLETMNEGIWVTDKDSFIKFANPKIAQMLGYSVKELIGEHVFSFMDEKGMELSKKNIQRRRKGVRENYNFELIKKDSTRIHVRVGASPLLDNDGAFLGSVASITDISELKGVEDSLDGSISNYQVLIDSLEIAVILVDKNMHITSCNKRFRNMCAGLGASFSPIGKPLKELADILPKRVLDGHKRALQSGKPESIRAAFLHNKKKFLVGARILPVSHEGKVSGLVTTIQIPIDMAQKL